MTSLLVLLTKVRPALLADYKARRRAEEAAPKTLNDELTLLGHAYKLACKEWEWVTENPVQKVSKEKVRNQIERWLTPDEEARLLAASPSWLQEIILFAVNTGLRQSEILNLQWPQVDLFRRTVTLLEQKNGDRDTLPVNAAALGVLKARARVRSLESSYVFSSEAGTRRDARHLLRAFYPPCRQRGWTSSASMTCAIPLPRGSSRLAWTSTRSQSWGDGRRSRW